MTKRAVLYARVSTDEQATNGYSLPTQLAACRRYAAEHGLSVVAEIQDDISGAVDLEDRLGGQELLRLASQKQADAVIVYRLDRLSRPPEDEASKLLTIVEMLRKKEMSVHDCETGEAKTDLTSVLMVFFKGVGASEERKAIRERSIRGKMAKAAEKWVGATHVPFGYRRQGSRKDARLVIHEPEAAIIRQIFHWYVQNGVSLRGIVQRLHDGGVPTRTRTAWHSSSVKYLLTNEIYCGLICYGKTKRVKGKQIRLPKEEWLFLDVPELAIIDRAMFVAAQARLIRNKELSARNRKREYLLSGYFRCGHCGNVMRGGAANGYKLYYQCKSMSSESAVKPLCTAVTKSLMARMADEAVWNWLTGLLSDENELEAGLQDMVNQTESELEPKRARLETLDQLIEGLERRIKVLAAELANHTNETVLEALQAELKIAGKQQDGLKMERASLATELAQRELGVERQEQIKAMARVVRKKLGHATFEMKRELFESLNLRVTFFSDEHRKHLKVTCQLQPEHDEIVYTSY